MKQIAPRLPDALKIQTDVCFQQPKPLVFELKQNQYHLIRLTSDAYYRLRKNSIAIEKEYAIYLLHRPLNSQTVRLMLSEVYIVLKHRFGESSPMYDPYKGSFIFPFFLRIDKPDVHHGSYQIPYLFSVRDYKGNLEFALRRIIDSTDEETKRDIYYAPFENEFSNEEIDNFYTCFDDFLQDSGQTTLEQYSDFFFHKIEATFTTYGYANGKFFHNSYKTSDEFDKAIRELKYKHTSN